MFALLHGLCQPWSLPSSNEGFAMGVAGEMSMGKAGEAELTHRPGWGTCLGRSGLIWGPERNSEKGTGAKSGAITS